MVLLDFQGTSISTSCSPTDATCSFHEYFQSSMFPYGLTSAPLVFTKVMVEVAGYPRRLEITLQITHWLVAKGGLISDSCPWTPDNGWQVDITGLFHQRAEVTPNSFTEAPFHLSHLGHVSVSCIPFFIDQARLHISVEVWSLSGLSAKETSPIPSKCWGRLKDCSGGWLLAVELAADPSP